ncbi:MAG: hypothetical protein DLM53_06885 [Candidatus Eremiobacter antarcticus]|nr:ABC transporter ATP-binding protein [Candidatus Eremiobacteraeota bacterium]MBC5808709.1 ABC transporter ATP-binding protein [Candidatus Eremiobacteraeota bacterium]PZR62246.1 MAG: hypothetical protein DLM53_06885 [Candidatus Eremiobacter sp. RRmetagenome_bin22]
MRGVSKRYGETRSAFVQAVDDVSIDVSQGQLAVLVGPSGCGKTTLLRLIAGLEKPDAGDIVIDGRRVNDVESKDRDVAMVFQDYALYPHMSVYDNMAFGLRARRVARSEIDSMVRTAAETVGVNALLERRPRELSGGQRQRVALGRAMVRSPKAFLLDEPLSNLDAQLRARLRIELAELHRRLGTTMVYVTHDQTEAMTLGDSIVVLSDGKVQQAGSPGALYDDPDNVFVAGFIGSPPMNLIPDGNGRLLGLRPEAMGVVDARSAEARFEAIAGVTEHLGFERLVHASARATPIIMRMPPHAQPPQPGSTFGIAFADPAVARFDEGTGKRIR